MVISFETLVTEGKFLEEEWKTLTEPVNDMTLQELWDRANYDSDTLRGMCDQHAFSGKDYEKPFSEYANKIWKPGRFNEHSWDGKYLPPPINEDLFHYGMKRTNEKITDTYQWDFVKSAKLPFAGEFDHLYKPLRRNWKFTKRDPNVVFQQRAHVKIITPRVRLLPHVQEVLVDMMEDMMKKKERKLKRRQEKLENMDKKMREIRKEKEKAKEFGQEMKIRNVSENEVKL